MRDLWRSVIIELTAIGIFIGIDAGLNYLSGESYFRHMPRDDINIEEGFVKPSEIEIMLNDLGRNGKNENNYEHRQKNYFLKYDKDRTSILQPYKVRPTEIIPKQ